MLELPGIYIIEYFHEEEREFFIARGRKKILSFARGEERMFLFLARGRIDLF